MPCNDNSVRSSSINESSSSPEAQQYQANFTFIPDVSFLGLELLQVVEVVEGEEEKAVDDVLVVIHFRRIHFERLFRPASSLRASPQ